MDVPNPLTMPAAKGMAAGANQSPHLSQGIQVRGAYIADLLIEDSDDLMDEEDCEQATEDIRFPHQGSVVSHMAIDIGGSLIKLCYWTVERSKQESGGRLRFRKFPTDRIDSCIGYMRQLLVQRRLQVAPNTGDGGTEEALYLVATGGGAYKFYDKIRNELGVQVMREDEMQSLIIGLDFFISRVPREVFTYSSEEQQQQQQRPGEHGFVSAGDFRHPYLLVNIGSGVSIIKVSGPREYARVGGTSLGGGTLWGLLSLLTGSRNFEQMLHLAEQGDNTNVDMLVGDIYGADYSKVGLKSTIIASTFGKVYRKKRQAEREAEDHGGMSNGEPPDLLPHREPAHQTDQAVAPAAAAAAASVEPASSDAASRHISFRPEDISKSLLYAISNNIGQIAYLHAEKHECEQIYFGGSFIGGHWQTMSALSYAINFWSNGDKRAFFLRHEGYLGAVGAFLATRPAPL